MFSRLKKLLAKAPDPSRSLGLCTALIRDGWRCHRFPDSDFVVALPHDFPAGFDSKGVLVGTLDGSVHHFSATLQTNAHFASDPKLAFGFVDRLAAKAGATPVDKGTYRYFKDPTLVRDEDQALGYTFYVIGVPGAVVVVSIASTLGQDRPQLLKVIENAVPDLIGELE